MQDQVDAWNNDESLHKKNNNGTKNQIFVI